MLLPAEKPRLRDADREAWDQQYRDSVLSGLEMTAAQRFEWLERTWAELAAQGLLTFESTHAPRKP